MTGCLANWKDNFHPHRLHAFACRLLSPSLIHNLKERKQDLSESISLPLYINIYMYTVGGADLIFNFSVMVRHEEVFKSKLFHLDENDKITGFTPFYLLSPTVKTNSLLSNQLFQNISPF